MIHFWIGQPHFPYFVIFSFISSLFLLIHQLIVVSNQVFVKEIHFTQLVSIFLISSGKIDLFPLVRFYASYSPSFQPAYFLGGCFHILFPCSQITSFSLFFQVVSTLNHSQHSQVIKSKQMKNNKNANCIQPW